MEDSVGPGSTSGPLEPNSGEVRPGSASPPTPRAAPVTPVRRVRRWPWILASLRVLGVGAVAYGQREVAAEWREGAEALETQRDAGIERDVFSQVTGRIAAATDALDDCVGRLFELQTASVDAFNRSTAGEPVDVVPLNATAAQVNASCNEARNAAADAGAAADRLLGP